MDSFELLIKPVSADCNLECTYCFYRRVEEMYPGEKHRMSEDLLEQIIADFLSCNFPVSVFSWQGGEPTLAGLDFFKRVVNLQKKHGFPGQVIGNSLQTNGVLVDEDWARFLREYKFLVGISLDGPEDVHNFYRPNSWRRVMDTIQILRKHQVEFNILTVVSEANVQRAREIYQFFVENGLLWLQFVPCLEWNPQKQNSAPYSIGFPEYGKFLCQIFDEWIKADVGRVSVRMFDSILSYYSGQDSTFCTFADRCDSYMVVEFNGDVYPCDFFVYPEWRLGNLKEQRLIDIANLAKRQKFASRKGELSEKCQHCKWVRLCRGGCQKDRLHPNGGDKKRFFCGAYQTFFSHSEQAFRRLDRKLSQPR